MRVGHVRTPEGPGQRRPVVARAFRRTWFRLVAGLAASAAAPAVAAWAAPGDAAAPPAAQAAPAAARATPGQTALNQAAEAQKRGDYDIAARMLREAAMRPNELTPPERELLSSLLKDNAVALRARREASRNCTWPSRPSPTTSGPRPSSTS